MEGNGSPGEWGKQTFNEKAGEFRSFTKVKVDKVEFQAGGQKFEEATVSGQFQELATDDIPF